MESKTSKIEEPTEQNDFALKREMTRAMEMMKRVKKSSIGQTSMPSDEQRLPSYFIPDVVLLCQTMS